MVSGLKKFKTDFFQSAFYVKTQAGLRRIWSSVFGSNFFQEAVSLGGFLDGDLLLFAKISCLNGKKRLLEVRAFKAQEALLNVKPLYNKKEEPFLACVLQGSAVLVRELNVPLKKKKDIESVLAFEAEVLLPYPIEDAVLGYQILKKEENSSDLLLFSVKKERLEKELLFWQNKEIEPESLLSAPLCLFHFSSFVYPEEKNCLALHIGQVESCVICLVDGQLVATHSFSLGVDHLKKAFQKDKEKTKELSLDLEDVVFSKQELGTFVELELALKTFQKEVLKSLLALEKAARGVSLSGIILTGPGSLLRGVKATLKKELSYPILEAPFSFQEGVSWQEKERFAMPIGAAIGSFFEIDKPLNFRKPPFEYPFPWKRLKKPFALYFLFTGSLFLALVFLGQAWSGFRLDQVKKEYASLLAEMKKPLSDFEADFSSKTGEVKAASLKELSASDLTYRLHFLEKQVAGTADLFPLDPRVPLVSDVLAWLNHLPVVLGKEDPLLDGASKGISLESFNYSLVKRPQQNKKTEKYQVKVELDFISSTPKRAREFHDFLVLPNEMVDPKSEVKWSFSRGRYHTSFYLKNK